MAQFAQSFMIKINQYSVIMFSTVTCFHSSSKGITDTRLDTNAQLSVGLLASEGRFVALFQRPICHHILDKNRIFGLSTMLSTNLVKKKLKKRDNVHAIFVTLCALR